MKCCFTVYFDYRVKSRLVKRLKGFLYNIHPMPRLVSRKEAMKPDGSAFLKDCLTSNKFSYTIVVPDWLLPGSHEWASAFCFNSKEDILNNNDAFAVRLKPSERETLDRLAKQTGRTRGAVIRRLLDAVNKFSEVRYWLGAEEGASYADDTE